MFLSTDTGSFAYFMINLLPDMEPSYSCEKFIEQDVIISGTSHKVEVSADFSNGHSPQETVKTNQKNCMSPLYEKSLLSPSLGNSSINDLPKEILSIILSYAITNSVSFCNGRLVSKSWKDVTMIPSFTELLVKNIIEHIEVFGNKQWNECGGEIVIDEDIEEESRSLILFEDHIKNSKFSDKKLQTLLDGTMFIRIPGALTLEKINDLIKSKLQENGINGDSYFKPPNPQKNAEGSYWIWVSVKKIPGSVDCSRKKFISDNEYHDCHAREIAARIFVKFSLTGKLSSEAFFSMDIKKNSPVIVGSNRYGLEVYFYSGEENIGILGLLRWLPPKENVQEHLV